MRALFDDGSAAPQEATRDYVLKLDAPADAPALLSVLAGLYPDTDTFAASWTAERRFEPAMEDAERQRKYRGWQHAVARTLLRPGLK